MSILAIIGIVITGIGTLGISINLKFRKLGKTFSKIIGVLFIAGGTVLMVIDSSTSMNKINT